MPLPATRGSPTARSRPGSVQKIDKARRDALESTGAIARDLREQRCDLASRAGIVVAAPPVRWRLEVVQRPLAIVSVVAQLSYRRARPGRATAFSAHAPRRRILADRDRHLRVTRDLDLLGVSSCCLLRAPARDLFECGMNVHTRSRAAGEEPRPPERGGSHVV